MPTYQDQPTTPPAQLTHTPEGTVTVLPPESYLTNPPANPPDNPTYTTPETRAAILRLSEQGMTLEDIAHVLHVTEGTALRYAADPQPEQLESGLKRCGITFLRTCARVQNQFNRVLDTRPDSIPPIQLAIASGIFAQRGKELLANPGLDSKLSMSAIDEELGGVQEATGAPSQPINPINPI